MISLRLRSSGRNRRIRWPAILNDSLLQTSRGRTEARSRGLILDDDEGDNFSQIVSGRCHHKYTISTPHSTDSSCSIDGNVLANNMRWECSGFGTRLTLNPFLANRRYRGSYAREHQQGLPTRRASRFITRQNGQPCGVRPRLQARREQSQEADVVEGYEDADVPDRGHHYPAGHYHRALRFASPQSPQSCTGILTTPFCSLCFKTPLLAGHEASQLVREPALVEE